MCKIVSKNAHSFKSALISMYAMQFHLEMSKNIYSNTTIAVIVLLSFIARYGTIALH